MPVQKQTRAGQRTRFKAFVAIGDHDGHIGLGVKCSKEVATAIRGAIILAKLSVIPVRLVTVSKVISSFLGECYFILRSFCKLIFYNLQLSLGLLTLDC